MPSPQVLSQPGTSMRMKIPRRNPCAPLKLFHFSTSPVGWLRASACLLVKEGKKKPTQSVHASWAILTSGWPRPSDLLSSKAQRGWRWVVAGPGSQAVASWVCTGAAGRRGTRVHPHLSPRKLYVEKIQTRSSQGLLQKTETILL